MENQCTPLEDKRNLVVFTRKFREKIANRGKGMNLEQVNRLLMVPTKKNRVFVDLSDDAMRAYLSTTIQPLMCRGDSAPPGTVGTARRIAIAIAEYERKTSNLDLFDDLTP